MKINAIGCLESLFLTVDEPNILFKPYSFWERSLNLGSKFNSEMKREKYILIFRIKDVRTSEELAKKKLKIKNVGEGGGKHF